jgi:hypothetical protein
MKPFLVFVALVSTSTVCSSQTGEWTNVQPANAPPWRAGEGLAFEPVTGTFVVYGGSGATAVLNDTHVFDGCSWAQHFPPTNPGPNTNVYLATSPGWGRVVLFGGNAGAGPIGTTWEYDALNQTWTNMTPAGPTPTARELANMAYDSYRGRTVLFGGGNAVQGFFHSDTWEWDGNNWLNVTPPGQSPPPRAWHAMAFDVARARTVLYGGYNGSQLGDTWEWDGMQWTQAFTASSPGPRSSGAMAYDPWSQRVVLFGGSTGWPNGMNDTWEYDGLTWTPSTIVGPTPPNQYLHRMAGDPLRGGVIVYGAYGNGWTPLNDTWRYRRASLGANTLLPPVGSPVSFTLSIPGEPGFPYLAAVSGSGSCPGVLLPDGRVAPLNVDAYTTVSVSPLYPSVFQNFSGALSPAGTANLGLVLPPFPWLIGSPITTVAVTASGPGALSTITNPVTIVPQ